MLSPESSPQDGDLACRQPSSPLLKSSNRGDKRDATTTASGNDKVALPEEVDLLIKSGSLPKFSIRDYVYRVRSKDIKASWPFSQRSLQLCLKHGVKDPLPPFQRSPSRRSNQFSIKEASFREQHINANNLNRTKPPSDNHASLSQTNKYAPVCNTEDEAAAEIPRELEVATIHSQSEAVESSSAPLNNRLSSSLAETPRVFEASARSTANALPPFQKGKRCKFVLKLGSSSSDRNTAAEDIASNCTTPLLEAMASKVCPVCKTFSSSSNTTLNAHIDQCLSVESTSKWVQESQKNRHRIKPRKIRLMADICATAPPCTLEELDRRNGSNWAAVDHSILPTRHPDAEVCNKEKRTSHVGPGNNDDADAGAVYVDASGTKLRILSELNDALPSALRDGQNPGFGKALKKNKGSKITKKKKKHLRKHHKYLKLAPERVQSGSLNACKFKIRVTQEGNSKEKDNQEKTQDQSQRFKAREQLKPWSAGPPSQLVCSKRTSLLKKGVSKDVHQVSGCKLHVARNLLVESDQSSHGDSYAERSCAQNSPSSSETPISTPGSRQRMENSTRKAQVNIHMGHSPTRKRAGCRPFLGAQLSNCAGWPLGSVTKKATPSRKEDDFSAHDSFIPQSRRFNHPYSSSNKTIKIHSDPFEISENSPPSEEKSSWCCHESSSDSLRFTGLTKKPCSVTQLSIPESKSKVNERHLTSKKPQVQFAGEIGEVVVTGPSEVEQHFDLMCSYNRNESFAEVTERLSPARWKKTDKEREKRPASSSNWKKSVAAKIFHSESQGNKHDVGKNSARTVMSSDSLGEKSDSPEPGTKVAQFHQEDSKIGSSPAIAVGETMSLSGSLHPGYDKLTCSFDPHSNSLQSIEKYKPRSLAESSFGHGNAFLFPDEVVNGTTVQNTHTGEELESKLGQQNPFSEVEPIPIPGPPGSYLPSPRGMSSDDLQGNSSLTTSRIQSSWDPKESVDGDSSDSPISTTSTIDVARSDRIYSEKIQPSRTHRVQDKVNSSFLGTSVEPVTQQHPTVAQTETFGVKSTFPEVDDLDANGHVCCCSWKERISRNFELNYHESQLLRRRAMSMGTQMGCPPNARVSNSNGSHEILSIDDCLSSALEKITAMKSPPTKPTPMRISPDDAAAKFQRHGELDSACPSASSPILRLMGKNLMVANKDADAPTRFRQPQPVVSDSSHDAQLLSCSLVSPHNNHNHHEYHPFYHAVAQSSDMFCYNSRNQRMECLEGRISKDLRGHNNFAMPQTPPAAPAGMFLSNQMEETYMERVPSLQRRGEPWPADIPSKDIAAIDDANYIEGLRGRPMPMTLGSHSTPVALRYRSANFGPFSHDPLAGPPLQEPNASFRTPPSSRRTSSGGALQRNPFTASPPTPAGPLRSALYHSPSLS